MAPKGAYDFLRTSRNVTEGACATQEIHLATGKGIGNALCEAHDHALFCVKYTNMQAPRAPSVTASRDTSLPEGGPKRALPSPEGSRKCFGFASPFFFVYLRRRGTFHTQADNKSRPDGASPCGAAAVFSFCAFRRGSFLRRIRDFCRGGGGVSFCAERHGWRAGVRAIPVRFIFPSAPGPLPGRAASSAPRRGISGGGVSDRTTGSSAPPERRRRHRSDPYREY